MPPKESINDVIKALAFCSEGLCDGCPFEKEERILCEEAKCAVAYYYLEEYKKDLNNPTLTWEELEQMRDEPVWIQEGDHGYWIIIKSFSITSFGIHWLNSAEGCLEKEDMGISWNAYRRKI